MEALGFGSPAANIFVFVSAVILQPFQFLVPTLLIASKQPRRNHFARRLCVACIAFTLLCLGISLVSWFGLSGAVSNPLRYTTNFFNYSLVLAALIPCVLYCFDTGFWNALFCVTAGYTIQNLGSGLGELGRIVYQWSIGADYTVPVANAFSTGAIIVVTALAYLFFVRKVNSMSRLNEDVKDMFAMFVLVILIVIAYDVIIRGLGNSEVSYAFQVALRIVHAAVCIFVLFAEYKMIYSMRLKAEVATQKLLQNERERQYELARSSIDAVNRKVHDIRHAVVNELAESGAKIDRATMKEVVRDVDVYGAQIRTGNAALDTVLTEKALLCHAKGITLTCVADGAALDGLPAADLYALFGSLLDGAISASQGLASGGQRSISLTVRQLGSLALIHMEHYANSATEEDYEETRQLVERHGGTLAISSNESSQAVDIMLSSS